MPFVSKLPDVEIPDKSVYEFLIGKIRNTSKRTAVIDNSRQGRSITFKEIDGYSKCLAGFLRKQGLRKGDYVAVCAGCSIEYPVIILGILACGATVTFCNSAFTKDEILQQFRISKPKMVFVDEEAVNIMKQVLKELDFIKDIFVNGKSKEFEIFQNIIKGNHENDFPTDVRIDPFEDIALLPYSSGTTGLPKCVMMTHRNIVSCLATKSLVHVEENNTVYLDRPVYHIAGFLTTLLALKANAKLIFNKTDSVKDMFQALARYEINHFIGVPSFMIRCINSNVASKCETTSVRKIVYGAATAAPEIVEKMRKIFNARLVHSYAMTECLCLSDNGKTERCPKSVGYLLPNTTMKIVDLQTDKELSINESGEILVKSPSVMKGYLNNDEANSKAFTDDGWFRTGDVGYFDEDERLFIIDRIKEVIKYKSVQVSPVELESVILKLHQVKDVGVIGIPDAQDGEIPKAFVVRKDESLSEDQIYAIVKNELADYKQLRGGVAFVDEIPKSATGKIQRKELKKMAGII